MSLLSERWNQIAERLNQRSTRERALVMTALLALLWVAFDVAWLSPHTKALSSLEEASLEQGRKRIELVNHLQLLRLQVQSNVNDAAVLKKQQLLKELGSQQDSLLASGRNMLSRDEAVDLLQRLLQARGGLQTLSLKNLKPEPAVQQTGPASPGVADPAATSTGSASASAAPAPVLWRHGIELRIRGSYPEIVTYLQELEAQQPRLHWQSLQLAIDTGVGMGHTITATLVISTLSLEAQWLAL